MHSSATDRYLETHVLTAPPQKLRLMLVEAAVRSVERARQHMHADKHDEACEALIHAQQVVTEILAGLNRDADAPLARKVAAVYLFVFRGLMHAGIERDPERLDAVLKVLRVERETWRQVCQKLSGGSPPDGPADPKPPHETTGAPHMPRAADLPGSAHTAGETSSGFSLEA